MEAIKHDLLTTTISANTRATLHRTAVAHGLPVDDLVQHILGRVVPGHYAEGVLDGAAAALTELQRIEVHKLNATWPAPATPPMGMFRSAEDLAVGAELVSRP